MPYYYISWADTSNPNGTMVIPRCPVALLISRFLSLIFQDYFTPRHNISCVFSMYPECRGVKPCQGLRDGVLSPRQSCARVRKGSAEHQRAGWGAQSYLPWGLKVPSCSWHRAVCFSLAIVDAARAVAQGPRTQLLLMQHHRLPVEPPLWFLFQVGV